jgi:hypothetical protein
MIVNSGLNHVISSTADGKMKIFRISQWAKDWKENDIIDDTHQYG